MKRQDDRFDRQSFLGPDSEALLGESVVAVAGLGGGGSHIVQQLAHLGVGTFHLFDEDIIDSSNLNRLVGGTEADVRAKRKKVEIGKRIVESVNGNAIVHMHPLRWQSEHVALRECTAVFGCVDRFSERRELETYCRRFLIPYIDIGMDVHKLSIGYAISGQVILSMPGSPCMTCMDFYRDDTEAPAYLDAGGKPQVVWPNGVLASTAVGLFVQLICPWQSAAPSAAYVEYDGNTHEVRNSPRLKYLPASCDHFPASATGSPEFSLPATTQRR